MALTLEAGVDLAARLLARYDRASGWNVERSGGFWDAVALAHELGRLGAGKTIAVIDSAFDNSFRPIAKQIVVWPGHQDGATQAHGTVVALLLLAIAPEARLLLYPTSARGQLNESLVVRAIDHAIDQKADIINLSLGEPYPTKEVFEFRRLMEPSAAWPNMTSADVMSWTNHRLARAEFRAWLKIPSTDLTAAVGRAVAAGTIVIAAAGNNSQMLYVPAICHGVFAVSFLREARYLSATTAEVAEPRPPTFDKSIFEDFAIIQPEHVLGSSFASPLIAGFVALMSSSWELSGFRETVRLGGLASELHVEANRLERNERRERVMAEICAAAVAACPHRDQWEPCPECALFAMPIYNNFGQRQLNIGNVSEALKLLAVARARSPRDAYTAANFGVALAALAYTSKGSQPIERIKGLLRAAIEQTTAAVAMRPGYSPYADRLAEFQTAIDDPIAWIMTT